MLYTVEEPPIPSPAGAGWLLFYPFVGIVVLIAPLTAGHDVIEAWLAAGGSVLRAHDQDVERARPVDALHAVQLDVRRGGRA